MRRSRTRRFFVLGFFVATLLSFERASVQVARADVGPMIVARFATATIGLGFNYSNSNGLVIVYVASAQPPTASITKDNLTYCEIMQLPNGVTAGPAAAGSAPAPDGGESPNGPLYLYAQIKTPPCGSQTLSPLSLLVQLIGPGVNNPIMVDWVGASNTAPDTPAGYSGDGAGFGRGATAVFDGAQLVWKQQSPGTLIILQCTTMNC
jgi:hypothetical protein